MAPDVVATCEATGERRETSCAPSETCLGGACTALTGPAGMTIEPGRLRTPSSEGFFNAWSGYLGLGSKAAAAVLSGPSGSLEALGGERAARPVCASDGFVRPRRSADDHERSAAVLTGILWSDTERTLVMRAGVLGRVTLKVGDATLEWSELPGREGRPWVDEVSREIAVPKGAVFVTAVVEPASGGFFLRLREMDGRSPRGIAFAERVASASCRAGALLDGGVDIDLDAAGLFVTAAPRFRGWVPRLEPGHPLALDVAVRSGGKVQSSTSLELARAPLASRDPVELRANLSLPGAGAAEVRLSLDLGGPSDLFTRTMPSRGDLLRDATLLAAAAQRVEARGDLPAASRESFSGHVRVVLRALAAADPDTGWIRRHLAEAKDLAAALEAKRDPYRDRRGVVFRAHRSTLDERPQPYVLFVPKSYDPKKPAPLVVVAHGKDRLPEHALRTVVGEPPDEHMTLSFAARNLPPMPDFGAVLVAPFARGNAGVLGLGEADVLEVIDDVKASYAIDAERVSMTGYSLGGTMSFSLPLHRPDVFAASAPLCGYPNLLDYKSVALVDKRAWEPPLLEQEYVVRYAENGAHVPMMVAHGENDVPGRSKVVVDRYRELGFPIRFDVPAGVGHDVWKDAYEHGKMIPWLASHRAPRSPTRVRFATGSYRWDHAYWLRVVRMIGAPAERAVVDARYDADQRAIELSLTGVRVLAIDTRRLEPRPEGKLVVRVGGAVLEAAAGADVFVVRGEDGAYSLSDADPTAEGHKQKDLSGPIPDMDFHPVTVVYGTRDPGLAEANRVVAEHLSLRGGLAAVSYPVLSDVAATDAALAGRSVILVGGPASNALTSACIDKGALPVTFAPDAITLRGRTERGPDLGVALIFPRPELFAAGVPSGRSRHRYVALYAGLSPSATLASRMLPRYLPDYVVFDAKIATRRGGLLMDGRAARDAGFFSERWE